MKKIILLMVLLPLLCQAQDLIKTESGDLKVTPILHGTLVLEFGGKTIYIDPYGGAEVFQGQKAPDVVIITDIHGDHHNQKTLDALDLSKATIIAPKAVIEKLPEEMVKKAKELANGQTMTINAITVSALPMYNLPETDDSRHPKGRGNGYILEMGSKRIYISGDTEDIPEMRALNNIDVAFVCMNLPYTMDINQAASAVSEFKPKVVYPYHYRGSEGLSDVAQFKKLVNEAAPDVEVRLRQWYPEK
jgi:L-ascorbate metabolism protein UlaG (beta-lactamase superfamily)